MQSVPAIFNQLANGDVRPHSWGISMSFEKNYDDDVTFFTLNQSTLNGIDVLAATVDNPIQAWDYYEYFDYSERLIYMAINRKLEFPYSVVSTIADFQMNNYDKYFTPNSSSPIGSYILPRRPVRLLQGLGNTLLPQFVGLTQGMPEISKTEGTATFTATDFLTWIFDYPIRDTVAMQNVTVDEVLANIFTQFGLAPSQYDLAKGRLVIPFLFFEKNQQKAGDIVRPLMEAEGGSLWLDELGIIRFRPRLEQPSTSSYLFDKDNIVSVDNDGDDTIINHVIINTNVREVQEFQTIYSKSQTDTDLHVVPAGGTYVFKADLKDPALSVEVPVFGDNADVSWFTASLPDGTDVPTGMSVLSTELKTNTYDITFSNGNAFDVNIDQLSLWGQPAKEISVEPTIYDLFDQDSKDKYEDQPYTIDNNFIQNISQARSLGLTILDEYSEYADVITIEVKGNAAIQLSDIFEVDYEEYSGEYRVIEMDNKLQGTKFTQILKGRKYTPRSWFTLNQSQLNGTDVLAP